MDLITISTIGGKDEILKETKLSSSTRRHALLGTFLKPLKLERFPRPFVIGLTGGIASGKTSAAKFLAQNNCEVIDCDKLAHELYRKGTAMASKIAETFGANVMLDGVVDRKALGRIVFADKEKLKMLNKIVWPSLRAEVRERIAQSEAEYVVVDAEILLEAGWDKDDTVHQVWSCIVPQCVAKERIVERDHISLEEVSFCNF
ncbi:unnamed protein product [Gongylonema pulchrum]|uniref:Dephospho-CoA kinase n=1 Tax=Gongylonema pulchrum TaxID=637853 RepID=A0A3P7NLG0_9BILA|nr:unnamed protein product [Gongylonema pulchrum]